MCRVVCCRVFVHARACVYVYVSVCVIFVAPRTQVNHDAGGWPWLPDATLHEKAVGRAASLRIPVLTVQAVPSASSPSSSLTTTQRGDADRSEYGQRTESAQHEQEAKAWYKIISVETGPRFMYR